MLMGLVNVERKDGVATLTLNNAAERNTMTAEMVADIPAAMDEIDADLKVGALLVTGPAPPLSAAGAADRRRGQSAGGQSHRQRVRQSEDLGLPAGTAAVWTGVFLLHSGKDLN